MSANYKTLLTEAQTQIETLQATLDHLAGEITPRPLPVVTFYYPKHGTGGFIPRRVQVIEMNDVYLRGIEISKRQTEGKPKTYLIDKIEGGGKVRLISA